MSAGHPPVINTLVRDKRWLTFIPLTDQEVAKVIDEAVQSLEEDFSSQEVSVVFTNDDEIKNLNNTYRKVNRPTNVLSFPSQDENELGDIILAYETVVREAEDEKLTPLHHLKHLIVHGFLHLLGYDHETKDEAKVMENLEILILSKMSIRNPYEER